ncbi:MAG: AI-2E family transporter [Acidimicrobiales bacterium]
MPRAIALFLGGLVLLWMMGWLFVQLRSLLIMLAVSLMISFALEPAVNRLERLGLRRGLGTLLVFAITTLAAALFGWIIGRLVTDQSAQLIESGPGYIEQAQRWINSNFNTQIDTEKLLAEFQDGGRLSDAAATIAPNIVAVGSAVVVVLFQALTVAMFSYYLVADGPRLRRAICSLLPPARQREVLRAWEVAIDKTGGYMYSRAVLALASLIFHWIGFAAVGVPSPVALALWVAVVSQFVPVVGTYLAGTLPVLVALAEDPPSALWVLGLVLVYQQLENYLLAPRITAHTMQVHSAVAFGSVIAGAAILGPIGAVLALPVTATLTALASSYLERHEVVHDRLTRDQAMIRRRWLIAGRPRGAAPASPSPDGTVADSGPDVPRESVLPEGSP